MTRKWLAVGVVVLTLGATEARAELLAPVLQWGPVTVGDSGGSAYYLNDNVYDGNVLGARISYGPYEQDRDGAVVNSLKTTPTTDTAKSSLRIGDYVYFTGSGATSANQGVFRTQVANTATPWTAYAQCAVSNQLNLETISTDGTYLYGSTTVAGNQVHAYSVDAATGALSLLWSTSGINGRVRGLDWDASGFLYAVDGGGTTESALNNTAHLYAIAAGSGAVTDMGSLTFNGRLYQTVREGSQIAVFDSFTGSGAPKGQMYVYDLLSDTSLVSTTAVNIWDPDGIDQIYGAAIDNGFMWLASAGGITDGYMVPEPSSWVLLLGGLVLGAMCRFHRRQRAR
jgi:hypothetical protein